jgi:hydrogenase nickel incorporation protein HypA/HybF
MHELAITHSLINLVLEECRDKKIMKPRKIITELGELSPYSKECVLFYYDLLKKEQPLIRETTLEIEAVAGRIHCNNCGNQSMIDNRYLIFCPACDSFDVKLIQGKEFTLKTIDCEG